MIELINKDKKTGRITFILEDATPAFANTLRRTITENVPTMAIEEIEIRQNSSALYDEMLAHRIGLIPLITDLESYEIKQKDDEYNAKNSLKLTLKAKGPCTVYAEDIKSKDPKVIPAQPKTPIVKLLKGQEIELEATAILGTGKQHVKFSPGLAWYTYKPTVKINNNHAEFAAYKNKFPQQAFKDGKIDAKLIEQHNLYEACDGVNKEIVNVEYDNKTFIFNIEPWGQLTPMEILATATERFTEVLKDFSETLGK